MGGAAHRRGRAVRHRAPHRRRRDHAAGHLGHEPGDGPARDRAIPNPDEFETEAERDEARRALAYMDLAPGTPIEQIKLDRVFIGSCTNSRIGDLRAAAQVVEGRKVAGSVNAMVVPGLAAGQGSRPRPRGSTRYSSAAGFDWREAGCSMCLGMNPDTLVARRALRLDLQPQLRGPPGPRRADPPRLAADGRGGRRSRATSSTSGHGRERRRRRIRLAAPEVAGASPSTGDELIPLLDVQEELVKALLRTGAAPGRALRGPRAAATAR